MVPWSLGSLLLSPSARSTSLFPPCPRRTARSWEAFNTWQSLLPAMWGLGSGNNNSAEIKGLQGRDGLRGSESLSYWKPWGWRTEILPRSSASRSYCDSKLPLSGIRVGLGGGRRWRDRKVTIPLYSSDFPLRSLPQDLSSPNGTSLLRQTVLRKSGCSRVPRNCMGWGGVGHSFLWVSLAAGRWAGWLWGTKRHPLEPHAQM